MRKVLLFGPVLWWAVAPGLQAQGAGWPAPGDRVRISSPDASGEFLVADVEPDGFILSSDSIPEIDVPVASLMSLEISQGYESRRRGLVRGSIVGGALGGLFALHCSLPHTSCSGGWSSAQSALVGVGVGAFVGFVVSGIRERWQVVSIPGRSTFTTARRDELSPSRNLITRAEIDALPNEDAYAIVRTIRPLWLRAQSQGRLSDTPSPDRDIAIYAEIFLDEVRYESMSGLRSIDGLRDFRGENIERIEYIEPIEASTRYGLGYAGGIIRIVLRR